MVDYSPVRLLPLAWESPERCNLFGLLGNFQRYVVLRLGKFPNKLWYFLRKYLAACRLSFGCGCPYRLRTHNSPLLFFPFRSVGGGAVFSVFKGSFAWGGRMQGSGEEYYPKNEGGDCSPDGVTT